MIQDRGLPQVRVAELFGVSQPRGSDLVRGKVHRFSIDTLVEMLGHAGVRVEFRARPAAGATAGHPYAD